MNIRVFRIVYQTWDDFMSNDVVYWSYSVSFGNLDLCEWEVKRMPSIPFRRRRRH